MKDELEVAVYVASPKRCKVARDKVGEILRRPEFREELAALVERQEGISVTVTIKAKVKSSDGPRYKALGNSMAVPVMRWIGERIMNVESQLQKDQMENVKRIAGNLNRFA